MMYEQKAAELRRRGFKAAHDGQFEEARRIALFESLEHDHRSANRRTNVARSAPPTEPGGERGRRVRLRALNSWRRFRPHMLPLAALYMMLAVTGAVIADAFISFWGFSRSYLNWGTVIYASRVYSAVLDTGVEWHVLIPPSVLLSLFAAAFYFVSRGLHEVADPRLRKR